MIDISKIKFTKTRNPDSTSILRAELSFGAEMWMAPAFGELRTEIEEHTKESLSYALVHQLYGEVRDYIRLTQLYIRQITPDPRFAPDPELQVKIQELETRFNTLFLR